MSALAALKAPEKETSELSAARTKSPLISAGRVLMVTESLSDANETLEALVRLINARSAVAEVRLVASTAPAALNANMPVLESRVPTVMSPLADVMLMSPLLVMFFATTPSAPLRTRAVALVVVTSVSRVRTPVVALALSV